MILREWKETSPMANSYLCSPFGLQLNDMSTLHRSPYQPAGPFISLPSLSQFHFTQSSVVLTPAHGIDT